MNEKLNITPHPPTFSEDILLHADNTFSMKIGGTIYEVTTHFNPDGKQTVLEQFAELLKRRNF